MSADILVIGDSCIDEYVYGTVNKLSPEAPVMILNQEEKETKPGMAANVKANLEALGCEVDFITNLELITKTRFIDKKTGYHLLRLDNEPDIVPWSGRMPFDVESYDAIVISDYGKGFLDYDHISTLRENFTGPIFLDTKKTDLACFHGIFVKINELEYSRRVSINDGMIITLGSQGAMWKTGRDPKHETHYPAPKVEVFDVCGAGDTFLAAVAYKYVQDRNIESAIEFAIQASAVTVQHRGVYSPRLEEIL
jgi:D-beta-D-heptose 7-phosphate kinase/D-beta-D-heptose 1-phosphate adenosyltransferase